MVFCLSAAVLASAAPVIDDMPGEFDGYSRLGVQEVKALDAFGDPEFEGRGDPCVKTNANVAIDGRFGFNGSGGLRVKPPLGGKVRVDFRCKVVPQPGKKYVFSILRRRNENGFAHVVSGFVVVEFNGQEARCPSAGRP